MKKLILITSFFPKEEHVMPILLLPLSLLDFCDRHKLLINSKHNKISMIFIYLDIMSFCSYHGFAKI